MVRSFTLRDFPLVRRLSEQGVSLHAESALTDNLQPFWGALLNIVVRDEYPTFVLKSEEQIGSGFIQILFEEDLHHAHILYLSPSIAQTAESFSGKGSFSEIDSSGEAWLSLLDQAVIEVGQQGIQSLVAEVDENSSELLILRRAGFAVYARQDIWVLDKTKPDQGTENKPALVLHPRQASDDWDIQLFYANTVPRLVQLVEPVPPLDKGKTWILRDDHDELAAFVHVNEGSKATWLRFFIHLSAETIAGDIVQMAVNTLGSSNGRKVYCCVRRYEGWSPEALARTNFEIWGSQAVLVKHTVHHARRNKPYFEKSIENSGLPVSTPTIRSYPVLDQKNSIVEPSKRGDKRVKSPQNFISVI